jgi:hypothetical protein
MPRRIMKALRAVPAGSPTSVTCTGPTPSPLTTERTAAMSSSCGFSAMISVPPWKSTP